MNLKHFLLYLLGFFVYTQGYWERFSMVPAALIIELCVWVLVLLYFRPKHKSSNVIFVLIIVSGILSGVATGTVVSFSKYIRYLFYSYVVIDIMQQAHFSVSQFNRLLKFTVFLILLQGLAAVYQSFFLNDRVEGYVGMMSSLGGTTATAFPVIISGITMVVFCYSIRFKTRWYFLLLAVVLSGFMVGYGSGKRAIYYLVPIALFAAVIISYFEGRSNKIRLGNKKLLIFVLCVVMFIPVYFLGITNSGGYNYALSGNESNREVMQNMFEYTKQYETSEADGVTIGRSNTSKVILNNAISVSDVFFFGNGFLNTKDEQSIFMAGVGYGFVGFSRDLFSGGMILCVLTFLFLIVLFLRKDYNSSDSFSMAIRWVILLSFLIIHFFYSSDFVISLKINYILAIVLSFVNSSNYRDIKQEYSCFLISR